jgi:hypothetical protein
MKEAEIQHLRYFQLLGIAPLCTERKNQVLLCMTRFCIQLIVRYIIY